MRQCSFQCDFPAVGKGRARAGRNGRHYTPARTVAFETEVALCARAAMQGEPMTGGLAVRIYGLVKMPKSWSKAKRAALDGRLHTGKPDGDNIEKAIADALNGIVYVDDSQIGDMHRVFRWGEIDRFSVTIQEVEPC
jgi:Holliday junction resolvase RusA-like endonuclease